MTNPTWSTWREAVRVVLYRPHLRKSVTAALIVGTVLFSINQLGNVIEAGWRPRGIVWLRGGITYLVPFAVSNYGILVGTRRRLPPGR